MRNKEKITKADQRDTLMEWDWVTKKQPTSHNKRENETTTTGNAAAPQFRTACINKMMHLKNNSRSTVKHFVMGWCSSFACLTFSLSDLWEVLDQCIRHLRVPVDLRRDFWVWATFVAAEQMKKMRKMCCVFRAWRETLRKRWNDYFVEGTTWTWAWATRERVTSCVMCGQTARTCTCQNVLCERCICSQFPSLLNFLEFLGFLDILRILELQVSLCRGSPDNSGIPGLFWSTRFPGTSQFFYTSSWQSGSNNIHVIVHNAFACFAFSMSAIPKTWSRNDVGSPKSKSFMSIFHMGKDFVSFLPFWCRPRTQTRIVFMFGYRT